MKKLMLKAGLGVVAAGTLASAGVLAFGGEPGGAKPSVTVSQRPAHGSVAGFQDDGHSGGQTAGNGVSLGSFASFEDCDVARQDAQEATPDRKMRCVPTGNSADLPFELISFPKD